MARTTPLGAPTYAKLCGGIPDGKKVCDERGHF